MGSRNPNGTVLKRSNSGAIENFEDGRNSLQHIYILNFLAFPFKKHDLFCRKSPLADKLIGIFTWDIPHLSISHINTVVFALVIVRLTRFPHGGNIGAQLMIGIPHKCALIFNVSEPDEIL